MDNFAAQYADKHVLITGGLGTVGSTIAHLLVPVGAHVKIVDCLVPEYGGNEFNLDGIRHLVHLDDGDLRDADKIPAWIANQDVIFSLAGLGCHADSMRDPLRDMEMNYRCHLQLLEACRQINPEVRIVYASTRQVYGAPDRLPVTEQHPARPVDVNGIHKLAAEQIHVLYQRVHGLRTCALRMTNVLGRRMRIKDSRQVFYGSWFRALLEARPFEVWGGQQLRDLESVKDVAEAFLAAGSCDAAIGQVLNTGSGQGTSLRALADLMIRIHGGGEYVIKDFPADRKRIDIGDYVADISRIRDLLGWKPQVPLEQSIAESLDYYQAHLNYYL